MALLLALTMFHHLIDGFRNRDLRQQDADLLGVTLAEYTRSEEHTSELQSLRHLVCRLLIDRATTEIYTLSLHDALPIFHHLIDGFRNRDLRQQVADLLGVTLAEYTTHQMTYDLRRLRLKGLIYRRPKTNRYFVTPYGWKVAH